MFLLSLLIFCIGIANAQNTTSAVSNSGYVNISKDPPKPPYLEIVSGTLQFADDDGNDKIDANSKTYIRFEMKNSGTGPGLNLKLETQEQNKIRGLDYPETINLNSLESGKTVWCEIPLTATMDLPTSKASFVIKIDEANGFGSDPIYIDVETKSFRSPQVKVVDYKVSSQNSHTLQKRKPFDVQVLVQNLGEGPAKGVVISIPLPDNVYCLTGNENLNVGTLDVGEQLLVEYSFVTNNEYQTTDIPFNIQITESTQRFGGSKLITLQMNQGVSDTKLVVEGRSDTHKEIVQGSLTSSVDKNIPVNQKVPNRIALVIGNEDYTGRLNSEVNVAYARNDAETFKKYALNTLGVEDRNMHYIVNATSGQMKREIDLVAELAKRLGDRCEVVVYYAGHGFPDEVTKVSYLIPVDVDATNLGSAIKLSDMYEKFGNAGASRVTVFLDACFSGGGRNQGLLAARSVAIKPKKESISGNMVVFAATTGEQSALPYDMEGHGMFTYYLLKALQESKGAITYDAMAKELEQEVGVESLRINGKPQDPTVSVSPLISEGWKKWEFR